MYLYVHIYACGVVVSNEYVCMSTHIYMYVQQVCDLYMQCAGCVWGLCTRACE